MKILFCGDVSGEAGRQSLKIYVPKLVEKFGIDVVLANGENAAHGLGLTPKTYQEILRAGVDMVSMGNHTFDKPDVVKIWIDENVLVRPLNYPENTVGTGYKIIQKADQRICLVQLLGRGFMHSKLELSDPFTCIQNFIEQHRFEYDILVVDFHAETTAEKVAMGYVLDGKVALVVGTHTHIPTNDAHVLAGGTAYITDVGMCGDYTSVLGMTRETAFSHFGFGEQKLRWEPAKATKTLCAVWVDVDDKTHLARSIYPIILGDTLENTTNL